MHYCYNFQLQCMYCYSETAITTQPESTNLSAELKKIRFKYLGDNRLRKAVGITFSRGNPRFEFLFRKPLNSVSLEQWKCENYKIFFFLKRKNIKNFWYEISIREMDQLNIVVESLLSGSQFEVVVNELDKILMVKTNIQKIFGESENIKLMRKFLQCLSPIR